MFGPAMPTMMLGGGAFYGLRAARKPDMGRAEILPLFRHERR